MNDLPIPDPVKVEANPEFVRILRMARDRLWDGVPPRVGPHTYAHIYICLAVQDVEPPTPQRKALIASISRRLHRGRHCWADYETWLRRRGIPQHNPAQLQAARLRWIDQMIQAYEGERLIQKRPVLSFLL